MKIFSLTPLALGALIVLAAFPFAAAQQTLRLADCGATDYTIVLPEAPNPVQTTAAEELASFLGQVTGAPFPILSENQIEDQAWDKEKLLVLGPGECSKALLASAAAEPEGTIGMDGIILETVDRSIVLSGHPERGALYAVYTFLEDTVGIRWWTSTESTIPRQPTVEIPPLSVRYEPPLLSRDVHYMETYKGEGSLIFSARRKLNCRRSFGSTADAAPEPYGISSVAAGSFYLILPPQRVL